MQIRSEETHTSILEAANRLFAEQGYNATGIAEICALAGISKGAFYYHFPSKQALFMAMLESWLAGLEAGFSDLQQEAANIPDALRSMANMAGQVLQTSDANLPLIIEFWMQAYRDPVIWEATIAPYQRYFQFFTNLLEKGVQEGSLRDVEPQTAARTTVSIGIGLLLLALFDVKNIQWDEQVNQSMEMLLQGLLRRAG
jgi:AcrR family transcriptional regulator